MIPTARQHEFSFTLFLDGKLETAADLAALDAAIDARAARLRAAPPHHEPTAEELNALDAAIAEHDRAAAAAALSSQGKG